MVYNIQVNVVVVKKPVLETKKSGKKAAIETLTIIVQFVRVPRRTAQRTA